MAIDSIDLPNFIYFYLSVMEVVDAHSFSVGQPYAITKLNRLQEQVDLQVTPSANNPSNSKGAREFTGKQVSRHPRRTTSTVPASQ